MRVYTSDWVVPVAAPPIRRGAVAIEDGRIVAVAPVAEVMAAVAHGRYPDRVRPAQERPLDSVRPAQERSPGPLWGPQERSLDPVWISQHPRSAAGREPSRVADARARSTSDRPSSRGPAVPMTDLGDAVLLPAFVNAHTHLELSWMKHEALPRGDFMSWVRAMIDRRQPSADELVEALGAALSDVARCGTVIVGDVGNTVAALAARQASGLAGCFFLEMVGLRDDRAGAAWAGALEQLSEAESILSGAGSDFTRTASSTALRGSGSMRGGHQVSTCPHHDPPGARAPAASLAHGGAIRLSMVPHGPHSVSPGLLRRLALRARERGDIVSVHLAESRAEVDLLERGEGPFRSLLEEMGAFDRGWRAPGVSPAAILDAAGLLGPRTIAVHGVHLSRSDAGLLAEKGTAVCLCPRSNARLGVGEAPVAMFLEEGVRLALGTDSLASNDDLSVLAELAALRRLAPNVPPAPLLRAATLGGAEALGFADEFGSIEAGKRAALVVLRLSDQSRATSTDDGAALAAAGDEEPYAACFAGPDRVQVRFIDEKAP